jgi:hypothetical protein
VRGGAPAALSCFGVYTAADQTAPCLRWRQQPRSPRCRSQRFERVVSTRCKTCSAGDYERANLRCAYCVMCVAAAMMGGGGGGDHTNKRNRRCTASSEGTSAGDESWT